MVERKKKEKISICLVNESLYIIIVLDLLDEIGEFGVNMLLSSDKGPADGF